VVTSFFCSNLSGAQLHERAVSRLPSLSHTHFPIGELVLKFFGFEEGLNAKRQRAERAEPCVGLSDSRHVARRMSGDGNGPACFVPLWGQARGIPSQMRILLIRKQNRNFHRRRVHRGKRSGREAHVVCFHSGNFCRSVFGKINTKSEIQLT